MSRVATRYAKAIFELAQEQGASSVTQDFELLNATFKQSRDLKLILDSPVIDSTKKDAILKEIFGGKLSPLTDKFLSLLTQKGRSNELPEVVVAYNSLLDEKNNVAGAEITTAIELPSAQKVEIEKKLSAMIGKTIRAEYKLDANILGGFMAKVGDKMIDASVKSRLERLRSVLVN